MGKLLEDKDGSFLAYHKYVGSKYASLNMENTLPEILPTDAEIAKAIKKIKAATGLSVITT